MYYISFGVGSSAYFLGVLFSDYCFYESRAVISEPVVNGDYCYLHSFPKGTKVEELAKTYRCILINQSQVIVALEDPLKALDYMTSSPAAIVNKTLNLLGFKKKTEDKEGQRVLKHKEVDVNCEAAVLLRQILSECPTVTVEKPKLMSVKSYISNQRKLFKQQFNSQSHSRSVIQWLEVTHNNVERLQLMLNDNNSLTVDYQYPANIRQYLALCLYQSYTNKFVSCQYLPLHNYCKEVVELLLSSTDVELWEETIDMREGYNNFQEEQILDYGVGSCDRFFTMADGMVNSRFHVYYSRNGELKLDNFYNTSERADLTIGNIQLSSDDEFTNDNCGTYLNYSGNEYTKEYYSR